MRTTNYYSSGTTNYFYYKYGELFFHFSDNDFSWYCEFIFGPTMLCRPCS